MLTLIKKEIKEFFRSKSDIIVMLIFPVILIFVMGKSLDDLMSVEKNIFNNKTIYYRINAPINNEKNLQIFYDFMINFEKKTNVKFIENKNYREVINDVNNNKAICFMDIYDNKINYFRNEKKESTESKIFRNLYEQYRRKYSFLQTISKSNLNQMTNLSNYQMKISLKDENINEEEINSYTYYTFAELILIILYISTLTSISMYKERFLHTMTRLKVSNTNRFNILASKIDLGIIIGLMQTLVVYIVSAKRKIIADRMLQELDLGVTMLQAVGAYKNNETEVIMCVMRKATLVKVRNLLKEVDPDAFMIVSTANEVFGEGFKNQYETEI